MEFGLGDLLTIVSIRHLREIYFSSPNFEKVNFSELELT